MIINKRNTGVIIASILDLDTPHALELLLLRVSRLSTSLRGRGARRAERVSCLPPLQGCVSSLSGNIFLISRRTYWTYGFCSPAKREYFSTSLLPLNDTLMTSITVYMKFSVLNGLSAHRSISFILSGYCSL